MDTNPPLSGIKKTKTNVISVTINHVKSCFSMTIHIISPSISLCQLNFKVNGIWYVWVVRSHVDYNK